MHTLQETNCFVKLHQNLAGIVVQTRENHV